MDMMGSTVKTDIRYVQETTYIPGPNFPRANSSSFDSWRLFELIDLAANSSFNSFNSFTLMDAAAQYIRRHSNALNSALEETSGNTALHVVCYKINKANYANVFTIFQSLIDNGININAKNAYNLTPLHIICASKAVSIHLVAPLIIRNANVNISDHYGNTPLHTLCANWQQRDGLIDRQKQLEQGRMLKNIAQLLMSNNYTYYNQNSETKTPLDLAALCGNYTLCDLLMERNVHITEETLKTHRRFCYLSQIFQKYDEKLHTYAIQQNAIHQKIARIQDEIGRASTVPPPIMVPTYISLSVIPLQFPASSNNSHSNLYPIYQQTQILTPSPISQTSTPIPLIEISKMPEVINPVEEQENTDKMIEEVDAMVEEVVENQENYGEIEEVVEEEDSDSMIEEIGIPDLVLEEHLFPNEQDEEPREITTTAQRPTSLKYYS